MKSGSNESCSINMVLKYGINAFRSLEHHVLQQLEAALKRSLRSLHKVLPIDLAMTKSNANFHISRL